MQPSRAQIKTLRVAARGGDVDAARALLAHSVALGHDRLSIQRYFAARFLGVDGLDSFRLFCTAAASRLPADALLACARHAAGKGKQLEDLHLVASELLPSTSPFVLQYAGTSPRFSSEARHLGPGVSLLGQIDIGAKPLFAAEVVVRADGHFVRIGEDFCIGEMSTIHIAHDVYPTTIGDRVTVGHGAIIHACSVGDDCVIEDEVIILDGSEIKNDVLIEAGSVVFPRSALKSGFMYSGSPARPIREIQPGELEQRAAAVRGAVATSLFTMRGERPASFTSGFAEDAFVAATAQLSGRIEGDAKSSVYFGCRLDAGDAAIVIGANTNVQDNTIIDAADGSVIIGADTTIGHNVHLRAGSIGNRCLIGIGSRLAVGTIVEDDVLLAGGATTLPGQRLERGWLWGGRPARPISPLNDARRTVLSAIVEQYCRYSAAYRVAQKQMHQKGGAYGTPSIANHPGP